MSKKDSIQQEILQFYHGLASMASVHGPSQLKTAFEKYSGQADQESRWRVNAIKQAVTSYNLHVHQPKDFSFINE